MPGTEWQRATRAILIVAFVQMCRGVKKQREGEERNAQNLNGNGNISLQIAIFLPHRDRPL